MPLKLTKRLLLWSALSAIALIAVPGSIAQPPFPASQTVAGDTVHEAVSTRTRRRIALVPLKATVTTTANTTTLLAIVNQPEIKEAQRLLADATLRALPSHCRDNLKNFSVRYDNFEKRGLGGKTTIIIDGSVPDSEFIALLTHECAHVIHSNLMGSAESSPSAFKDGKSIIYTNSPLVSFFSLSWSNEKVLNVGITNADFVSGYAKADPFEDFAETFAAYVLHPQAIEAQAKESKVIAAKLQWMKLNLPLSNLTASNYNWNGTVPWDITKLTFAWK